MGKGLNKDKLRSGNFIRIAFLVAYVASVLLMASESGASQREFELFDKGYENYLSYQPEKAVEAFKAFLKEFPQSSAADAALFWLGKSFLQLKSYEEAGKYFSESRKQFPDSPFARYAEREAVLLQEMNIEKERNAGTGSSGAKEKTMEPVVTVKDKKKDAAGGVISAAPEGVEQKKTGSGSEERKEEKKVDIVRIAEDKKKDDAGGVIIKASEGGEQQKALPPISEKKKEEKKVDAVRQDDNGIGRKKTVAVAETAVTEGVEQKKSQPGSEEKKEETKTGTVRQDGNGIGKKKTVAVAETAGGATYTVQVGVFRNDKSANRLKLKFEQKGYRAAVKKVAAGEGTRFNVMVGEFKTRREAEEFAVGVKKEMDLYAFPVERERAVAGKMELPSGKEPPKSDKGNEIAGIRPLENAVKTEMKKGPDKAQALKRREARTVIIKGKRYTEPEILEFMKGSSSALVKSDIKVVPWRSGDAFQDFINEQVLHEEAKTLGVAANSERLEELSRTYKLAAEELAHVGRYLLIHDLIDRKMKLAAGERLVESLTVKYSETGNQEKVALASKLQEHARKGKSFEEIAKLYPGLVSFSVMRFQDLQDWLRENIKGLKGGDVSVVWKRGGYMILKPLESDPQSGMSLESPDREDAVRAFVGNWVEELKKKDKGFVIVKE